MHFYLFFFAINNTFYFVLFLFILFFTDVETRVKKQNKDLLKDLQQYIASQKVKDTGGVTSMMELGAGDSAAVNFLNVTKTSDQKTAAELY
jgi:hypothetical protein